MATKEHKFVKHEPLRYSEDEMISKSESFYQHMDKRRSVREYSDKPIPKEVIDN